MFCAVLKNKLPIEFLYRCFIREVCFSEAMPRSYKKVKTESYDKKDLELAILQIREDGYQVSTVRDRYGVPEQIIRDHLKREAKDRTNCFLTILRKKISRVLKKLAEAGHIRTCLMSGSVYSKC